MCVDTNLLGGHHNLLTAMITLNVGHSRMVGTLDADRLARVCIIHV